MSTEQTDEEREQYRRRTTSTSFIFQEGYSLFVDTDRGRLRITNSENEDIDTTLDDIYTALVAWRKAQERKDTPHIRPPERMRYCKEEDVGYGGV